MAKVRGLPEGAYFQRALTSNKRYLPKSANVQPAMKLLTPQNPAIRLGTKVGLVGGLALVSVPLLGLRGPMIYVPYTLLVLVLAFLSGVFKFDRWHRFGLVFTGFMVASLVLYLYVIFLDSPSALDISLLGHAWRLGFLAAIGAVVAFGPSRA